MYIVFVWIHSLVVCCSGWLAGHGGWLDVECVTYRFGPQPLSV